MKPRSPTLEGFQVMFRLPSLGLAEIAWRWSFGLALSALLAFSFREFLDTLPVTAGEILLLRTGQSALIAQALAHILKGSAPRAVAAAVVLILALTLAWIILASVGRAATLKTLIEHFRSSGDSRIARGLTSLLVLNFLRAATALAAIVSFVGAMLVATAASSREDPSPGTVLLIFGMFAILIGLAWSLLNWYLSLAAIFVVRNGASAFAALSEATELCQTRLGSMIASAIWFGLAHAVVLVVASSVAAFPLGLAEVLPGGMVLGGLLLAALLYFAAVDFLYVGRLAAYVFMIEQPETGVEPAPLMPPFSPSDDDILSDIPGLVPLPES
jgi:hypothetical protein